MKRGFTLVELLVVTMVIAILAGIVFRLAGATDDSSERQATIVAMQKLENCLSGYYAAFGSYPPVEVHGSRNPFYPVNKYGIQQIRNDVPDTSTLDWNRVRAACMSQPVAARFPYVSDKDKEWIKGVSDQVQQLMQTDSDYAELVAGTILVQGFDGLSSVSQLSGKKDERYWSELQLFQFGLMSFLLPRYLMMMKNVSVEESEAAADGEPDDSDELAASYDDFAQWRGKNNLPCRFEDGVPYNSWQDLFRDLRSVSETWKVGLIPSQAVTQRWLSNLEGLCDCGNKQETWVFYGVNIKGGGGGPDAGSPFAIINMLWSSGDSQSGENAQGSQQYILNHITVKDGFNPTSERGANELYYYSPPPYQSYRLWSAGPNGRTFPPWITDEQIRRDQNMSRHAKTIHAWIADDIVHLSN